MRPHPRVRKTVKWGGAVVSAMLLVVWVGSGWRGIGWSSSRGYWHGLDRGHVFSSFYPPTPGGTFPDAWGVMRHSVWWYWKPSAGLDMGGWQLSLPLWIPFCVSLPVTALAWRLDSLARRRAKTHLCPQCRYDRTGLTQNTLCPECGAAAPVVMGPPTQGI